MEVKIGVQYAPREIVIDVDQTQAQIEEQVQAALGGGVLSLADAKGRRILVPGDRVAYVELGNPTQGTVGFR